MTQSEWLTYALPTLALLGSGLVAGFMAGLFGIGGGFVVVPAIATVLSVFDKQSGVGGHVMHIAIGTSLGTISVTSLRSVHAHSKRGAVDFGILRAWTPSLIFGVCLGIILASSMEGGSLRLIFALGVFVMGLHFLVPILRDRTLANELPTGVLRASLGCFLGAYSALLGIGGGIPAVLIMTLSGLPMHRAIATAAGFGTVIAIPGVIGNIIIGWKHPDLPAGSLGFVNLIGLAAITLTSMITTPIGVSVAHSLDASRLKKAFGVYLLFTSGIMLRGYLVH